MLCQQSCTCTQSQSMNVCQQSCTCTQSQSTNAVPAVLYMHTITVNECCASSPVHAHNQTVTVMVLLTVLQTMSVKHCYSWGKKHLILILYCKLHLPFHVSCGIQTRCIVCETSVPHKYHIFKHFFEVDICSLFWSTVCTVHTHMLQLCNSVQNTFLWHEEVNGKGTEFVDLVYINRGKCTLEWRKSTWTIIATTTRLIFCVSIMFCICHLFGKFSCAIILIFSI